MPTFAGALITLRERLHIIKNREVSKAEILELFSGETEDCSLCRANEEFGDDDCKSCPASYSERPKSPCERVALARKRYASAQSRRSRFETVYEESLIEAEQNFQNLMQLLNGHMASVQKGKPHKS